MRGRTNLAKGWSRVPLYFEVVHNRRINKWHARIIGGNNEIVFASQLYTTPESAKSACETVQTGAATAEIKFVEFDGEEPKARAFRRQLNPKRHVR